MEPACGTRGSGSLSICPTSGTDQRWRRSRLRRNRVVFSHANLHAINPIPRNKTDDQIKALAARGGVMRITTASRLMLPTGGQEGSNMSDYLDQVDYMVDLVGHDHVGIGLDISEGMTQEEFILRRATFLTKFPELKVGGDFPLKNYFSRGLSSAAETPGITRGLVERGYSGLTSRRSSEVTSCASLKQPSTTPSQELGSRIGWQEGDQLVERR